MRREPNGKFARIAVLLTCVAMLVTAVSFTVRAEVTARSAVAQCGDHETRIRTIEHAIAEMASDIRVIRQIMEHQTQREETPR